MQLKQFLPILDWLPNYQKAYLKGDISAGLTVGILLIPQGMAYAAIAGLPLVYGLYASLIPQVIYAILGTARQLSVGPVAMDSLLVAAGVSVFAQTESPEYIALALLLAFIMGSIQFLFGVLRLGFLVNFLSRPVISGFTSAAAIIIGLSQLKHLLGVEISRSSKIHELLQSAVLSLPETNLPTFILGSIGIVIIWQIKRLNKRKGLAIPGALIVVLFGILSVIAFGLDSLGVKIVKEVPSGLPMPSVPDLGSEHLYELFPIALTLALIAFMESISVAKAVQAKHKNYEIDNNQELIALGAVNIVGAFFRAYPTTGGFSRTAINDQAGAKTGVASMVSALVIALTLLVLTPLFYYLPKAVLASIIMVAVYGLIDFDYPKKLWQSERKEFLMLFATFIITLTVGIREGILAGVALSLLVMIYETTRPHFAELGKLPESNDFRNVSRFSEVIVRPDVLILRYDAALYFANVSHFKETFKNLSTKKGKDLRLIILNCESINSIDSSAMEALATLINDFKASGIAFYLATVKGPVRDALRRAKLMRSIGEEHFFLDVSTALEAYDKQELKNDTYATQSNVK